VNKRIQNFRIVGCHKSDNMRIKKVVRGDESKCYITDIRECELLPDIINHNVVARHTELNNDDISAVLKICESRGLLKDHSFKFHNNGMFVFNRLRGSYCEFCNRAHDSDNTLIVTTANNNGIVTVFKQCRKYIDEHK